MELKIGDIIKSKNLDKLTPCRDSDYNRYYEESFVKNPIYFVPHKEYDIYISEHNYKEFIIKDIYYAGGGRDKYEIIPDALTIICSPVGNNKIFIKFTLEDQLPYTYNTTIKLD